MKPLVHCICALAVLAALHASTALAQPLSSHQLQLQRGATQLQAGDAEGALASGDAAVRMAPDNWDGYALAGRALLKLKRYEAAADAFSQAIERAPPSQQPALRDLRRQTLLQESAVAAPVGSSAVPAVAAPAVVAPATAAPATAAVAAEPVHAAAPAARAAPVVTDAAWIDSSTGLMWARPWQYPAGARGPWDFNGAKAFCSALRMLGHSDWRLPSVAEAQHIYLVSSKRWEWSRPQFAPGYGLTEAMKRGSWKLPLIKANGDTFDGRRLLVWTSTPGDHSGAHAALYFGRRYSVKDEAKVGATLPGEHRRNPYQGYALCVRPTRQAAAAP